MDDGNRCLLDVINDPNLLESFLDNNDTGNQQPTQATTTTDGHEHVEQCQPDVQQDQSTNESNDVDKNPDIVVPTTIPTSSVDSDPVDIKPNIAVLNESLATAPCPPTPTTVVSTVAPMPTVPLTDATTPMVSIPSIPAAKPKPKRTPTKKPAAKKGGQNTTVTSSTTDHAKQVDLVTSSGCVNSPPPFGTLGDGKKGINPVMLSPMSIQGTTTVPGGQLIRGGINPGQMQGWPQMIQRTPTMASPGPGGLPQVFQTMINGQQIVLTRTPNGGLITPTGQQVILGPPPGGGSGPGPPPPHAGQIVQIVQTPNGPAAQLIQQSPHQQYPVIQPSPPPPPPSKGTKGGNKQILPKPSSGSNPTSGRRNSSGQPIQAPTTVLPSNLPPNTIQIAGPNGQPQFIQLQGGPTSQGNPSIISGPNGTLLLNPYGGQNFGQNLILQGNNLVGNTGMPLQLQLRTGPNGQMVAVSSSSVPSSNFDTSTVGGFSTVSSMAPMGGVRSQGPTFVMSGQPGQQTMVMGPRGQQIMINRPQMVTQQPQLIQIQTPNGPMVIALQANPQQQSYGQQPTLMSQQGQPQFVQSQPMFGGQQLVQGPNGPMLVSTQNFQQPQPVPISPTVRRSSSGSNSSTGDKSNKSSKGGGVNLADLLKETGIIDSSPPTSPQKEDRSSVSPMTSIPPTSIASSATIPTQPSPQFQQQPPGMFPPGIVLGQSGQPTPQLRLAVTPEGNVILQPSLPPGSHPSDGVVQGINLGQPAVIPSNLSEFQTKILDNLKDSCGPGSSQPSPDSTTPTLDTGLPITGPSTPISGDLKVSTKSETESLIPVTVESLNTSTSSDTNIVPVHGSSSSVIVASSKVPVDHGTPVIDSSGAVQISLNNHEFLERLDNQIKELSSSPSLSPQQKQLLIEFTKLQNTISEAKKQSQQFQAQAAAAAAAQQQQQPVQAQVSNSTQPQLVNLLKPSGQSLGPSGQQIRLTPVNSQSAASSSSCSTTTYQLGNQLITISNNGQQNSGPLTIPTMTAAIAAPKSVVSTPSTVIQTTTQTPVPPLPPQLYQVVRLSQQPKSPTKSTTITKDSQIEKEKLRLKIQKLFNQQLTADQNAALRPDCRTPFKNRDDACKRLLRYHVFSKPTYSSGTLAKVDEQFESISKDLLIAKELLFDRFRKAMLKSSMRDKSSEVIMLDRLFVEDETTVLKFDKEVVAQGMTLDLPSPPESWKQEITASIDAEEERESRKRKLPFLDEDLTEHLPPETPPESERIKRVTINDDDDEDGTEEEDDDEDDDDDDSDSDDNQADDIAKYLGPNDGTGDESAGNLSDLNSLYGEPIGAYDGQADFDTSEQPPGDLLFDGLASGTSQDSWGRGSSFGTDTRNNPWSTRFAETEAAAAVDSILTSDDDEEDEDCLQGNGTMSMDGIDDEEEEEDDEDDDVEEDADAAVSAALDSIMGDDEVSGSYQIQEPSVSNVVSSSPCDVQMQSAIDSILQSSGSSGAVGYYDNGTGYSGRVGYESSSGHSHHRSSSIVSNFGHQPGQISDPVLDEAVKSILS